ncbi:MAG TPA: bifunctional chorismate mutase/prephenate dehydrogenase [Xanthomonadales bacterium]|nr:bifunctional chorismate mutase/prephenate dehydrogenase [Xanthomonadales bacterium]
MSNDPGPSGPTIARFRKRLDAIDARIMELVAERQLTVTRIGEQKHTAGHALRDFARERDVIERGVAQAESLGMPGEVARDVLERLIHHSLRNQEQRTLARSGHGAGRRALVVGGLGRMGDWMARYLDTLAFAVEIADPGPGESLFPVIADWRDSGLDQDVIVVAAPLRASNQVLTELAGRRPPGLVFDIGSLKSPLRPGLEAMRAAGCRIASVHPMFGPDVLMLSGRHILLVDAGHPQALAEAARLFSHTAADCVELGLDDHDEVMAWVLGLSHLVNIAFAGALGRLKEQLPLLQSISSSTFNAQLKVAAQVVSENPSLYFEIQQGTVKYEPALRAFTEVLDALLGAVRAGDEQAFVDIMSHARQQLAEGAMS